MTRFSKSAVALTSIASFAFSAMAIAPARADDGITPTEVVIGGTDPFSGPASAYGAVGKGSQAYFQYINDHGGVNGRKITYKDLDDGYSPPQTVQLTRQLVEDDKVFAIFAPLGTAPNIATRAYLNAHKVPKSLSRAAPRRGVRITRNTRGRSARSRTTNRKRSFTRTTS